MGKSEAAIDVLVAALRIGHIVSHPGGGAPCYFPPSTLRHSRADFYRAGLAAVMSTAGIGST